MRRTASLAVIGTGSESSFDSFSTASGARSSNRFAQHEARHPTLLAKARQAKCGAVECIERRAHRLEDRSLAKRHRRQHREVKGLDLDAAEVPAHLHGV